jgi:IPT/TIG domain
VPAPTVTAVSPTTGTTAGGTSVTITGTDLTGATAVNFGADAATGVVVVDATTITCNSPAHAAGTVDVTVTTPGGTSATSSADQFTYVAPAPTVTGVSPISGTTAGGTSVTITGTNLTGTSAVHFGTDAATSVVVVDATTVTCSSPAHAVGAVDVTVTTPGGTSATSSADQFTYVAPYAKVRYDQTNAKIAYSGSWSAFSKGAAYQGSYGRSSSSGAKATIYFTGTRLDWIGMKGTTPGYVDVYLDGVKKATINLYASVATYQVNLWSTGDIADGAHKVELVRSSSSTSGKYVVLDAVDIWGTITGPTRYDQTNTNIVYSGTWAKFTKTAAYNGSYGRSSTSGASATIYFTGTRLDWIGMKGTTTGIVDVYLDGVKKTTIDLTASVATYKVNLWSTGNLSDGAHYVTLVRSSSSKSGKFIVLDAVDIWGTITTAP